MIAQHYVGLNPQGFNQSAADVNGDKSINVVDALQVAQYYVGLLPSLTGCSAPETRTVFAVNCGGSAYTTSDGTQYVADTGYSGGTPYANRNTVSGTSDPTLYQAERYGDCMYSAVVPNGDYPVILLPTILTDQLRIIW